MRIQHTIFFAFIAYIRQEGFDLISSLQTLFLPFWILFPSKATLKKKNYAYTDSKTYTPFLELELNIVKNAY